MKISRNSARQNDAKSYRRSAVAVFLSELRKMIRFTRKTKSGHSGEIIEKPEVQKAGEGDLLYAARFWYRVDDFRIICNIQDDKILVTVLRIADRKEPVFGKI